MNALWLRCVARRRQARPHPGLDANYYKLYWASMQAIQRVTETKMGAAGFTNLAFANNVPGRLRGLGGHPGQPHVLPQHGLPLPALRQGPVVRADGRSAAGEPGRGNAPDPFRRKHDLSNCSLQGVLKD
jgi:hypothetical protein